MRERKDSDAQYEVLQEESESERVCGSFIISREQTTGRWRGFL